MAADHLDDRIVDRALGLLREVDPFVHWIDEGDATADLRFTGDLASARWALEALPDIDFVVQPDEPRWKRLFVADMDSTIIGQECLDERRYAGLKDKVAQITERAMQGELDFSGALRERVRLLAGLDQQALSRCLDERVQVHFRRRNWSRRCGPAARPHSCRAGSCRSPIRSPTRSGLTGSRQIASSSPAGS